MSTNIYTDCYGIVYLTTNLVNDKKYIGQKKYERKDFNTYLGSGKHLRRAIKKYGSENFKRETLKICYSKEELDESEVYFIALFNAVLSEEFYNIANGGQGFNIKHSEKSKLKMSLAKKGNKHSEETKLKMSLAKKGKTSPNKDTIRSKETRKKISDACKGIPKPQKQITCPQCGKTGGASNMKRWHFNNCKFK